MWTETWCLQVSLPPLYLQINVFPLTPPYFFFFHSLSLFPLFTHSFPSPFQQLFPGKGGSGNQHSSPRCESRLATTLQAQSDKAKDTHAPFFSQVPFSWLSAWLLGLFRFSALDTVPRSSLRAARGVVLCGGNTHEAPLQLLVLLLLHMAQMCTSSFSSLYLSAVLLGHTKGFRGGMWTKYLKDVGGYYYQVEQSTQVDEFDSILHP